MHGIKNRVNTVRREQVTMVEVITMIRYRGPVRNNKPIMDMDIMTTTFSLLLIMLMTEAIPEDHRSGHLHRMDQKYPRHRRRQAAEVQKATEEEQETIARKRKSRN